jgi:tRNA-uridine 2-sulfurtransferase
MSRTYKAVALISGGLDSMLAAHLIKSQGIHVEGINFYTGFCVEGHTHAIRRRDNEKPKRNNALWAAEQLGIKLHIEDVIEEYKPIVLNPKHGYGANLNPCLDCKGFMVRKAYEWMQAREFDFIITGEVIGQRPKSQRKATMPIIARESGAGDRLLRPLCAQLLEPTLPEREGWVDRNRLLGLSGRSRKPQMELATQLGFVDYAQPAGGCCFLTDENYAKKLSDLWQHRGHKDYELDDIILLKMGRHIRPRPHFKLIIAREEGEANFMEGYRKQFMHLEPASHLGALCLIDGELHSDDDLQLAAAIAGRYTQGRLAESVEFNAYFLDGSRRTVGTRPLAAEAIPTEWFV